MNRVRRALDRARGESRAALVVYLTQGDPSPAETVDIVERAAASGADIIELGVPFSDPNADGVVIAGAMQRALAAGGGLASAIDAVAELRRRDCQVPVVLFGYYNPVFVYGVERFAAAASAAGVDALLTVDVPVDELGELSGPLSAAGIEVVPLIAPTSGPERMRAVRRVDPPFVYYISMTGVTGSAFANASVGADRIALVRETTGAPVAVGFGIKTPDDVRRVAAYADGVVVGSAVVQRISEAAPGQAATAVADFVAELRSAL